MNAILAQYRARTPGSAVLMERSIDPVAGGVSRNFGYHIPYPVANERGTGARLIDVDGNWGSVRVGLSRWLGVDSGPWSRRTSNGCTGWIAGLRDRCGCRSACADSGRSHLTTRP